MGQAHIECSAGCAQCRNSRRNQSPASSSAPGFRQDRDRPTPDIRQVSDPPLTKGGHVSSAENSSPTHANSGRPLLHHRGHHAEGRPHHRHITGMTGQDGSYPAEFLLAKGYMVHGLIRRASSGVAADALPRKSRRQGRVSARSRPGASAG